MTATVTGGGPVTGGTVTGRPAPARRRAARRRFTFPRASTTPGQVRLIRMGLVIGCLGWGALAAVMVGQHASAAGDAASVSEPLSLVRSQLGALLTSAGQQSTASATGPIAAARQDANSWFAVNQQVQRLDKALDYGAETRLVIGSGPGTAGTLFGRLEADLDAAIHAGRATFAGSAATGSAWGLSRRLAEYR